MNGTTLGKLGKQTYDAALEKWGKSKEVRAITAGQVNGILLPTFFKAYDALQEQNNWMDVQTFDQGAYQGQSTMDLAIDSTISGILEAMMNIEFKSNMSFSSVRANFGQDFLSTTPENVANTFNVYEAAMDKKQEDIVAYIQSEKERNALKAEKLKEAMVGLNELLTKGGTVDEVAQAIESARESAGWKQAINTGSVYQGAKAMAKHLKANGAYMGARWGQNNFEEPAHKLERDLEGAKVATEYRVGALTLTSFGTTEPNQIYKGPVDDELVATVLVHSKLI